MKKEKKILAPEVEEVQEWDLNQQFGIFPENINLTQNIGCVGGKKKKDSDPKFNKN